MLVAEDDGAFTGEVGARIDVGGVVGSSVGKPVGILVGLTVWVGEDVGHTLCLLIPTNKWSCLTLTGILQSTIVAPGVKISSGQPVS